MTSEKYANGALRFYSVRQLVRAGKIDTIGDFQAYGTAGARSCGEVRVLPVGGDGNAILCRICFEHEMRYRKYLHQQSNACGFPLVLWTDCAVYGDEVDATVSKYSGRIPSYAEKLAETWGIK